MALYPQGCPKRCPDAWQCLALGLTPQQLRSSFGAAWVGREENILVAFAAVTAGRDIPQGKTPIPSSHQRPACCSKAPC